MDFDEYSFADLLSNIVDNRGKTCPVEDEGFPLIATNCIKDDSLYPVFEKIRFVSDDTYKNWFRGHPNAGDIIFVCKGSPGRVAWVKEPVSFCIAQDMVAIRADQKVVDPMFLFSLLRSEQVINKINNMHVGTLIPHFKKGDFKNLYLSIPRDLKLQRAIGLFYFSLSEKIEKNKQINQTLEQMAQALFKSWFVDFEPVKAKMAVLAAGGSQEEATLAAMTAISGKDADALAFFEHEHPEQYAELKTTAELFPSAMQESELGEIPVGWFVGDLSNIALLNTESWSKKNAPESVSYVDLANTKWGVINSVEVYKFSDAPSRARRILRPCDTIVGTVRPGNGSYSYISKPGLTGSTGFAVLTPKARIFSEYIYLCVTSNESIERLAHLADGGAYPAVNADVVLSTQCVLPIESETKEALLKVFSSRTEVFFSYRANNLDVNEVLTSTRDTLLPKLLSGEISLPEAEQIISEEA
ncbi:restriction endonuclease subunit S [Salmonella enterica]|uniref:Restriction endonuclease subunit S n=1 Tax=Salmonella enterica TaxID=28901 RepID=A0A702E3M8_SALER|nr:restriction endonuclease subunit S [Salmonella enterica]HAC6566710.1 restriction endonuclease subunit S [Salmonella enterica subsp. indica]HBC0161083.1 restriction endonuclease subunit S [Salmonella enterica subsp. indica]HCM1934019.1 restriction endonuclease subunit S [Salmonella enterica subsp. indica serovar 6,7:z41:1,7]HCM1937540.1 restriction endonuclease subunit S [Salmonella enterica subsp. indica serovar 6,7:z41:1,7]